MVNGDAFDGANISTKQLVYSAMVDVDDRGTWMGGHQAGNCVTVDNCTSRSTLHRAGCTHIHRVTPSTNESATRRVDATVCK